MKYLIIILIFFTNNLLGQILSGNYCLKYPDFIKTEGYDLNRAAFSTSEVRKKGLFLNQYSLDKTKIEKQFHPASWESAGFLGGMIFDRVGNVYTFSAPHVNLIDNPPIKNNNIYIVDNKTAELKLWKSIPLCTDNFDENPFGVMGLTYHCMSKCIYASSISGSKRYEEKGKVYCIDEYSRTIKDSLTEFDGFGLCVISINGKFSLLMGNCRNSNLYSVDLADNGKFISKPTIVFSIENMGLRGDDKIRKIVYNNKENTLTINSLEFNFNLAAVLNKPETNFKLKYDLEKKSWYRVN